MPTHHALDMSVLEQDLLQCFGTLQSDSIHVGNACGKRRMVHGDDRGSVVFCKTLVEPGQPSLAELAASLRRNYRVEHD